MESIVDVVALVAISVLGAALARRLGFVAPLVLLIAGLALSYVPGFPQAHLKPELVLIGILPPLLYVAALQTSVPAFRHALRPILLLAVGLVVLTAFVVGFVVHALLPAVPIAAAFALGAVVAPPDAVAATAIARRIGLPRRVVTLLEGESLLNDATALVCLRTAIAALGGYISAGEVALDFLRAAVGGVVIGIAVAWLVGLVRKAVTESVIDTSLSFMAPFVAYLPAEALGASGVLAVVVAGLLLGHRSPLLQDAPSRLSERVNWATIQFLLENSVFLLIGLQVRWIVADVSRSDLSRGQIVGACLAVLAAVIVLRPMWVFPVRFLAIRPGPDRAGRVPSWRSTAIISWAGMRGVVTLAAVFALPEDTPQREVLVLIAMVVTAGTLVLQGFSLPWLARRLGLHGPDPREDALQEATVLQSAVRAGMRALDECSDEVDEQTMDTLRRRVEQRVNIVWERLGNTDSTQETPSEAYRRLRLQMLAAERKEVLRIRDAGEADHEVLEQVMGALDLEESMLDRFERRDEAARQGLLLPPEPAGGACEHLRQSPTHVRPLTPQGCPDCEREGTTPVHLRMCLSCGNIGCCDSSVGKHADRHYDHTGHPVMRSFEPGEAWRWCYVDDLLG